MMSTALVKQEIGRFLASAEPEVLCIRGKWGTGKTYSWKIALSEAAKRPDGLGRETYSYVSLFGLNSLIEVKRELFHNIVRRKNIGKEFDAEEVRQSYQRARDLTKIGTSVIANMLPGGAGEAGSTLTFLTVRDQLVCIDDLERKGEELSAGDVLGLISMLKEDRNCKVAILLNDEALQGKDEEEFRSYLEKVVDVSLHFDPTPAESTAIAIHEDDETSTRVRDNCIALGIQNIRVMAKILRLVRLIAPKLKDYEPGVLHNVVDSLVLFAWSHHEPKLAPSKEFLHKYARIGWDDKIEAGFIEQEAKWRKLLDPYPFHRIDEFDLELIKGVSSGYFAPDAVTRHSAELHSSIKAGKAMAELQATWDYWRYSFRSSADDVIAHMSETIVRNLQFVTPDNLNSSYDLFKQLGREDEAKELLDTFLKAKADNREALNIDHTHYRGENFDPDVRAALEAAYASSTPKREFEELLIKLSAGWDSDAMAGLNQFSAEDFERVFLAHEGDELRERIIGLSDIRRVHSSDPNQKSLIEKFRTALLNIAKTNPVNAERVRRVWGVVEKESEDEPAPEAKAKRGRSKPVVLAAKGLKGTEDAS
jgi:hypothetical protein